MKPYNFYFFELIIRAFYFFFSYCLCLITTILNVNAFFLFEIYPFMKVINNRFISTCITDFVDSIWILSSFISVVFVLPLFIYHINSFFYNSWYKYQVNFYKKLTRVLLLVFLFTYFFIHHNLLSNIFTFFYIEK